MALWDTLQHAGEPCMAQCARLPHLDDLDERAMGVAGLYEYGWCHSGFCGRGNVGCCMRGESRPPCDGEIGCDCSPADEGLLFFNVHDTPKSSGKVFLNPNHISVCRKPATWGETGALVEANVDASLLYAVRCPRDVLFALRAPAAKFLLAERKPIANSNSPAPTPSPTPLNLNLKPRVFLVSNLLWLAWRHNFDPVRDWFQKDDYFKGDGG